MCSERYIQELSDRFSWSDYRIAKELMLARSTVSRHRSGKGQFTDETCLIVAKLLELEPLEVIARVNIARTDAESLREFWSDVVHAIRTDMCVIKRST